MQSTLSSIWRYWMRFARLLGQVNAFMLFSVLFVAVVGVYAMVFRVRDAVRRRGRSVPPQWCARLSSTPQTWEGLRRPF